MHPNTRDTCWVVVWGHFPPPHAPIWGQRGPKYGYFLVKIRPLWRAGSRVGIQPGKCFMSHITYQSMGQHYLGPLLPSPGTYGWEWCKIQPFFSLNQAIFMAKHFQGGEFHLETDLSAISPTNAWENMAKRHFGPALA